MKGTDTGTSFGQGWGTRPARVNGIAATLTLLRRRARLFVLDSRGQRLAALPADERPAPHALPPPARPTARSGPKSGGRR